jgi:bifunctional non-homologous end joining protein LigD
MATKPAEMVLGVPLSSPERVYWPEDGVTKRALADYFAAVADRMLPELLGRPLSLIRAPEGLGGPRFFQRHAWAGAEKRLRQFPFPGQDKPALAMDSADDLVWLAQQGVLEIHASMAREADLEHPDRLTLDLDPGEGVPFEAVRRAALLLKARLEAQGLRPFAKATGGKGLHLVLALPPGTGWDGAGRFARAACAAAASEDPARFTTDMRKPAREGRIFLDYLRNERGASAVAPWSPRARPGATVALPLAWEEVEAGFDPRDFAIPRLAALLARPDPWAGLQASARPVPES